MISRLFSNDSFNCFELSVSTEFPNWITFSAILGFHLKGYSLNTGLKTQLIIAIKEL